MLPSLTLGLLTLFVQLAYAAGIAWWWNTEQGVPARGEPVIEPGPEFRERPDIHDWGHPTPAWQDANHFDPGKVALGPTTIRRARVHLLGHLCSGVRRCAFENLGIVVVKPLDSMIPIERLDVLTHPATEITMAVGVDFDFASPIHLDEILFAIVTIQ